jgi:hypothetical protein
VIIEPCAEIVVLTVHEKDRIKSSNDLKASPGYQPGRGVHRGNLITTSQIASVGIGDESGRLRGQIVQQEVAVQKGAGVVEVDGTRNSGIVAISHEAQEQGDRARFDLRILVQKEDKISPFSKCMSNSNIVGSAKAEILALLYDFDTIDRSRYRDTFILGCVIDNNYANRMLAESKAVQASLQPGSTVVVDDDCKHIGHE